MITAPEALREAMRLLPHGREFRFLDRLLGLDPGQSGVGEYHVCGDEFFLRGQSPGEAVVPGVVVVEAGAQLAGVVAQNDPIIPPLPRLRLSALRAVQILGSARPGDTIRLEARLTARLGPLVQATAAAFVSDVQIMSAELTLGSAPHQRKE